MYEGLWQDDMTNCYYIEHQITHFIEQIGSLKSSLTELPVYNANQVL